MKLVLPTSATLTATCSSFSVRPHPGPMKDFHGYGQGDVVNALLVKRTVGVGMVDEDPRSMHHPLRDVMRVVRSIADFELREKEGRYLAILKPELESAFLRAAKLVGVETSLPSDPRSLRQRLFGPVSSAHSLFQEELSQVYAAAKAGRHVIFLTELVDMLEKVSGE